MHKYSWLRDLPDFRDIRLPVVPTVALPPLIDLRPACPPVYDQGDLGSCVANASAAAFEFGINKQSLPDYTPSRLAIYYCSRTNKHSDDGSTLRDALKVLNKTGAGHEQLWPYVPEKFSKRPPATYFTDAKKHQAMAYRSLVQNEPQLKGCLAAGLPFVFGFSVFQSFESDEVAATGLVPMPNPTEAMLGGHAVMAVGYDDSLKAFIVRNSWGIGWGIKGYFYLNYQYVTNAQLASDFWTVQTVE